MFKTVIEPLVSIVIPVYNSEDYLEEALCSVTEQSYKNLEIICINDGSADKSPEIIKRFRQIDNRIRLIDQENLGAGAARNLGMKEAKGEYILFFDSDDMLHKKMIQTLVKAAVTNNTDIVLFGYQKFSHAGKIYTCFSAKDLKIPMNRVISPADISDRLFQADHGMPWNKFYKADFLKNSKVQFQLLKNTNDEFFSRITTVEAKRILFLKKILIEYRVENPQSLRGKTDRNILDCTQALRAIHDELINRGYFETYFETYKKLAGYIIMLRLLATNDTEAFKILAEEISENTLDLCEVEEKYLEDRYKGAYRALKSKDISKAESEINLLRTGDGKRN